MALIKTTELYCERELLRLIIVRHETQIQVKDVVAHWKGFRNPTLAATLTSHSRTPTVGGAPAGPSVAYAKQAPSRERS